MKSDASATFICVGCGEGIKGRPEGSMKAPFCKPCFTKRFKDYDAYKRWMASQGFG